MKLLLITENEETRSTLLFHLKPVGFEVVRYASPLKAMDNIDELDPEVVVFSAVDFPRHWKPFVKLLRERKTREESVCILLKGDSFPFEEAAKAVHLGVNGILADNLADPRTLHNLQEILVRYGMVKEGRETRRYIPREYDELEFILTLPKTLQLVTGSLLDISQTGACFVPDQAELTAGLAKGSELPGCSLKVGEQILAIDSCVLRNGDSLALQFLRIDVGDTQILRDYLANRSRRALERLKRSHELV